MPQVCEKMRLALLNVAIQRSLQPVTRVSALWITLRDRTDTISSEIYKRTVSKTEESKLEEIGMSEALKDRSKDG
jgi:hypothetical protein